MIFAAGLGTRLKPLTDNCPKALIPVGDKPMLQIVIEQLKKYGFNEIILNVHYLAEQIYDFIEQNNQFGISISFSDETNELLETGGGLWKAHHFFDDGKPFLLCNADVLTNINLEKFYSAHLQSNAISTLAIRERNSSRYLLFDDDDILFGWENVKTHEVKISRKLTTHNSRLTTENYQHPLHERAFSGYHIISPEIFTTCKRQGVFSMVDWYLDICNEHTIKCYHHNDDVWIDIGSPEQLVKANEVIAIF
ncbi:MAG TPA: nucleotidyltransferase family protein [Chitinophagales bacterium]|nr:nucleotidyltransferase family protein [Chitinophagales bacterium]